MIKLTDLLKEITEGKQVGTLYHYTDIWKLYKIIKQNTLLPSKGSNKLSLTRSKHYDFALAQDHSVIVLDGDKLSNNYKITPHHDISWNYNAQDMEPEDIDDIDNQMPIDRFKKNFHEDEKEETIKGPIKNLNKYIIKVIINKDNTSIPDFVKNNPKSLQNVNQLIDLLKEKNIPYEIKDVKPLYPKYGGEYGG
jgi:hypothetical protein